jgi:hypothetical protein
MGGKKVNSMLNKEELRPNENDRSRKTTFYKRGKVLVSEGGGGRGINVVLGSKYVHRTGRPLAKSVNHKKKGD